jgi:hypothetical protein
MYNLFKGWPIAPVEGDVTIYLDYMRDIICAGKAAGKKDESLLKDLITGKTIETNDKYVPVYSVPNHLHLCITGNPDCGQCFVHRPTDLRPLMLQMRGEAILNIMLRSVRGSVAGGYAALMHYFLNYEYGMDLRIVPVTDELIEQKKRTMSGVKQWAINCAELGEWPYGHVRDDGSVEVIKKLMHYSCNGSPEGRRNQLSENEFGIAFLKLFPKIVNGIVQNTIMGGLSALSRQGPNIKFPDKRGVQQYGHVIPPLRAIRDVIDATLGGKNIWEDSADWSANLRDFTVPDV